MGSAALVELPPNDPRELRPLYTFRRAAAYVGVKPSTLHSWTKPPHGPPLVTSVPTGRRNPSIPFIGLAEAFVLAMCRARGMTSLDIRDGVAGIKRQFHIDHALAHRMIYTSQGDIALRTAGQFVRARDGQLKILEVARANAQLISFGEDDYADRIILPVFDSVTVSVSPYVADGRATVKGSWFTVDDVVERHLAGEDPSILEEDFGLTYEQVLDLARAFPKQATS